MLLLLIVVVCAPCCCVLRQTTKLKQIAAVEAAYHGSLSTTRAQWQHELEGLRAEVVRKQQHLAQQVYSDSRTHITAHMSGTSALPFCAVSCFFTKKDALVVVCGHQVAAKKEDETIRSMELRSKQQLWAMQQDALQSALQVRAFVCLIACLSWCDCVSVTVSSLSVCVLCVSSCVCLWLLACA